jgi:cation transporter-like permease
MQQLHQNDDHPTSTTNNTVTVPASSSRNDDSHSDDDDLEMVPSLNPLGLQSTSTRISARARRSNYLALETSGVATVVWHRTSVLVSLLLLQSLSQFILEMYETLIAKHVIIPLFLTMLVGAGGNAGNQATVRAITGLVTKEFRPKDYWLVLRKELVVGIINSVILACIGFGRVYYFYGHQDMFYSTVAITLSLFCIVLTSVLLGSSLPFLIGYFGYDREHAAPIIQVLMDITGVFITCSLCSAIIPESEHRGPATTAPHPTSSPTPPPRA